MPVGLLTAARGGFTSAYSDERYARTDRKFIV
jgi:hypothetical protein